MSVDFAVNVQHHHLPKALRGLFHCYRHIFFNVLLPDFNGEEREESALPSAEPYKHPSDLQTEPVIPPTAARLTNSTPGTASLATHRLPSRGVASNDLGLTQSHVDCSFQYPA